VDSTAGLRMATDAAKKELDGLLNAGRQACRSLQMAGSASLSAIGLTKKLLLVPGLVADWKQSSARGGARTGPLPRAGPGLDHLWHPREWRGRSTGGRGSHPVECAGI
jgi:hypothetical protein